jgi:hypothetical protein
LRTASAARAAAEATAVRPGATVVAYRTYVNGVSWELERVLPTAGHLGELEPWFLPEAKRREIFWSRDEFWSRWGSGRPLVVLLRWRDAYEFELGNPRGRLLASTEKYRLFANW